uniref:18.3 kDa family n=1 Tax=Rhipicephalus zambeziensis TaxID=60191 RepID=A0A224YBH6_9ACAR
MLNIYITCIAAIIGGHPCFSYDIVPERGPCRSVMNTSSTKRSCYYACYHDNNRRERGQYIDGTKCWHPTLRGQIGSCMRGNCILPEGGEPHINNTLPEEACDDVYRGHGFASRCQRTCKYRGRYKRVPYAGGTPCIPINKEGQRSGNAGICMLGICRPYDELETRYPQIEKKVFLLKYQKCPDKDHFGKNVLWSCYYYCKQNGSWFFGYYKSNKNSACELFQPDHRLGWCCRGKCMRQANCGRVEGSVTGPA